MDKFFSLLFIIISIYCSDMASIREELAKIKTEQARLEAELAAAHHKSEYKPTLSIDGNARASLSLSNSETQYAFELFENQFTLSTGKKAILQAENEEIAINRINSTKTLKLKESKLRVNGNSQWQLAIQESFEESPSGWSTEAIYQCAGINMLGGYCNNSSEPLTKKFKLPDHSSVRVSFNYHFIDSWDGASAYAKATLDHKPRYIWTQSFQNKGQPNAINICGGHWPETKLSETVDISFEHTDSVLFLEIGSTLLEDPCDESFGISDLKIYLK